MVLLCFVVDKRRSVAAGVVVESKLAGHHLQHMGGSEGEPFDQHGCGPLRAVLHYREACRKKEDFQRFEKNVRSCPKHVLGAKRPTHACHSLGLLSLRWRI
mmetsp:Transcript_32065/g.80762  ORF Transcript_32065/g.80762 Transcript_32065/m.80762 type:complete len:101 (-) Transcript_32065:8-310(-)